MGMRKHSRRPAGKQKKKSYRSTALLGSKRRLSRFGKEQQRGGRGISAHYVNRSKAIKMLQISLNDFRRLCVLKGIYPRVPPGNSSFKKKGGRQRAYYHVKDIRFLAHEPLLAKFRSMKTFMKKIKRRVGKNDKDTAMRMWENRPDFNMDHLVRERYPNFTDAVRDLDDALCLIYLFAQLPSTHGIKQTDTDNCARLAKEWEAYVTRSRALKKVFVSVKGIYYQARVHGEDVTWLVPHQFHVHMPKAVDFQLMGWFLDFYQVALRFIMFKLYHNIGLRYPPVLDADLEADGAHLTALTLQERAAAAGTSLENAPARARARAAADGEDASGDDEDVSGDDDGKEGEEDSADDSAQEGQGEAAAAADTGAVAHPAERLATLKQKLPTLPGADEAISSESGDGSGEDAAVEPSRLLSKFVFFLSREVPRQSLEFCIMSFGGRVGWAGPGSPFDETSPDITHHVVDRVLTETDKGREYVQPQYVYDCVNAGMMLPVARYLMGASLPPHLSPFVDNAKEGYTPDYANEIENLRAARAGGDPSAADGAEAGAADSDSDSDSDGEGRRLVELSYTKDLNAELRKARAAAGDGDDDDAAAGAADSSSDGEDEEESAENEKQRLLSKKRQRAADRKEEERQRQLAMMSKKRRRLYERMQNGIRRKQDSVRELERRRDALAEQEGEQES